MVSVTTTAAGAAAVEALGRHLDRARNGSALAPAVVICNTPVMAVGLRRALGARSAGIAGVTVTTVRRFAEDLVAPDLLGHGRRLARPADQLVAIRAELAEAPGRFDRVADHRTTEARLASFQNELVGLPDDVISRLAASAVGLSGDALRVAAATNARLGHAVGGDELMTLTLDRLQACGSGSLGPLVIFLPEPLRPFDGRLVQALARRDDCEVIVGTSDVPEIDDRHFRRLAGWSIQVDRSCMAATEDRSGRATVLEVTDPEDEVRAAVRDVSAHAAAGVPLPSMAVLYATTDPYAELVADQLRAAGLPFGGQGHRSLATSLAGRTLRRLLSLSVHGLERGAVITLVSSGPIDGGDGRPAPAAAWNRVSRQAGVIDGEHWVPRLAELAGATDDVESKETTQALSAFVEELASNLRPPDGRTWSAWSTWVQNLLDRYLLVGSPRADRLPAAESSFNGSPAGERAGEFVGERPSDPAVEWPSEEVAALSRIQSMLDDLGGLDEVGAPPRLDTFESTVAHELWSMTVPGPPLGFGVHVGPVESVAGLPFERVIVLGLTEGVFPRSPREDSLLPDQLRAAGGGMLMEKSAVTDVDVRSVAMATAGSRRPALLLTSRGDLRSNRSRTWPRVLSSLVGSRQSLDSHYRGLVDHGRPASVEDFGLRALIGHVEHDDPVHTHELAHLDTVLATNLARIRNRARPEMTRHVGRVPAGQVDPVERLLSPTALETYAACPRKYLFQRVLRLGEDERPERIDEITARDRGTLVHRVLERFIADAIADDAVPTPDQPWPVERRAHVFDLLAREIKLAENRGVTGGAVKTALLHRSLIDEMHRFLDRDDELRSERRSTPVAVEFSFGFETSPALEGLLPDRPMHLRGSVDRVDVTEDDGLLVIDYKGGSDRPFRGMEANPLDDGRRLQLPLYARAVAERLARHGRRTGLYWLTKMDSIKEMVLDEKLEADLEDAVGAALDGIGGGVFPGVPGDVVGWPRLSFENCKYCDFDRICPTDRQSEWERVRHDEVLTPIDRLVRNIDPDPEPVSRPPSNAGDAGPDGASR